MTSLMEPGVTLPPPPALDTISGLALFLDLDGTLAALVARPEDTAPDPHRNKLLAHLQQRLDGRLAIISGRSVDEVDRILDGSVKAVAGIHGLDRRTAFGERAMPHPSLADARAIFHALAETQQGLIMEDKGLSVTLHYRGIPEAEPSIRELGKELSEQTGLVLQEGLMVVELRSPGPDKGDAIAAFMAEAPFAGARPIFVGDDLTDEHGFAVVERAGGIGVLVGSNRETGASRRLADVAAVIAWLGCLAKRARAMSRLIVVSNRVNPPSEIRSIARRPGHGARRGPARIPRHLVRLERQTVEKFTGQLSMQRIAGVTVATIDLEEQDAQEYYNGYANKTLWPLFHYRIDLTAYERSFGEGYDRVNGRFAETLRPLIEPDDFIWVHDYHLIPLARELRKLGVTNRIGFFLHIPWPARQLVATLPRHRNSSRRCSTTT